VVESEDEDVQAEATSASTSAVVFLRARCERNSMGTLRTL